MWPFTKSTAYDDDRPISLVGVLRTELQHLLRGRKWLERYEADLEAHKDSHRAVKTASDGASDADANLPASNAVGDLNVLFDQLYQTKPTALCFSGGGIRSATFALGLVESLASRNLLRRFDYLSTVSGGGYLGSWLSAWIRREQLERAERRLSELRSKTVRTQNEIAEIQTQEKEIYNSYQQPSADGVIEIERQLNDQRAESNRRFNPATEPKQMQFLREYSNYITPKVGLLSADTWTFVSIYLRNLLLNWLIFVPLIAAILIVPKVLLEAVKYPTYSSYASYAPVLIPALTITLVITGSIVLFVVIHSLPSLTPTEYRPRWTSDGGVVVTAIVPLVVTAFLLTTLLHWRINTGRAFFEMTPFVWPTRWIMLAPAMIYVTLKVLISLAYTLDYFFKDFKKPNLATLRSLTDLKAYLATDIKLYRLKVFWHQLKIKNLIGVVAATVLSSIIAVLLLRKFVFVVRDQNGFSYLGSVNPDVAAYYTTFAVPAILIFFTLATTIFVGMASRFESDGDREWFARFGAWTLIVSTGWIVLNSVTFWGHVPFERGYEFIKGLTQDEKLDYTQLGGFLASIVGVVSGLLTLIGGFSGKSQARETTTTSRFTKFLSVAPQIAAVVFIAFLLANIAQLADHFQDKVRDALVVIAAFSRVQFGFHLPLIFGTPYSLPFYLICIFVLLFISIFMACLLNVNKFSLHGAYRDRLVRAYLGASKERRRADPFTGFDDQDNFQLHRLKGQRPFHVINATLNLVDGEKLAWQNRKAATFTMTPLHCGSWALYGYRNTNEYSRNRELGACEGVNACNKLDGHCDSVSNCRLPGKSLRIGTAMAISGAAVNPNMGYSSSPVVMFLMALFNIRLGWWLGNTNRSGGETSPFDKLWVKWLNSIGRNKADDRYPYYSKPSPMIAFGPLISETFGKTDSERKFINVSDGGHFDNLGLYEMVLRRCKYIILSDGTADNEFAFDDLANAIEKCEVDLGVEIEFVGNAINIPNRYDREVAKSKTPKKKKRESMNKRFALAHIKYPENKSGDAGHGLLIYVKPTMLGDEPVELKHYARAAKNFPHQSTADQFYDEKQFEAYRQLGYFTMNSILEKYDGRTLESIFKKIDADTKGQRRRPQWPFGLIGN